MKKLNECFLTERLALSHSFALYVLIFGEMVSGLSSVFYDIERERDVPVFTARATYNRIQVVRVDLMVLDRLDGYRRTILNTVFGSCENIVLTEINESEVSLPVIGRVSVHDAQSNALPAVGDDSDEVDVAGCVDGLLPERPGGSVAAVKGISGGSVVEEGEDLLDVADAVEVEEVAVFHVLAEQSQSIQSGAC